MKNHNKPLIVGAGLGLALALSVPLKSSLAIADESSCQVGPHETDCQTGLNKNSSPNQCPACPDYYVCDYSDNHYVDESGFKSFKTATPGAVDYFCQCYKFVSAKLECQVNGTCGPATLMPGEFATGVCVLDEGDGSCD